MTGVVNEHDLKDYCVRLNIKEAEVIGNAQKNFYKVGATSTANYFGTGTFYLIGARGENSLLADFYESLFEILNLINIDVFISNPNVSVQSRIFGNEKYLFITNFSEDVRILRCKKMINAFTGEHTPKLLLLEPFGVKVVIQKNI